jgi:hypothetical protein
MELTGLDLGVHGQSNNGKGNTASTLDLRTSLKVAHGVANVASTASV